MHSLFWHVPKRVAQQISRYLRQSVPVRLDKGQERWRLQCQVHSSLLGLALVSFHGLVQERSQVKRGSVEAELPGVGQGQQAQG
ncbi:MAG: hypothetical protein DRJ03_05375 [Chloroflexi bacterium]|nr:MAG: hypothetical protein DRI81_05215 [Chloroflexota bacterium]RLC87633.1 MAG: hypothetical protein DRJ03_05375 [Chloroflexota bacterium]